MSLLRAILVTMRPYQWVKNLLFFTAVIFDGHLTESADVITSVIGFGLFCLISSSVYLLNDAKDAELDRQNPDKAHRPIAAGHLSASLAFAVSVSLTIGVLVVAFTLGAWRPDVNAFGFGVILAIYYAQNLLYTWWSKRQPLLDVMSISVGFVLRILAGGLLIGVEISQWAIICTFFLSLFLGLGKRRYELTLREEGDVSHRPALAGYSLPLVDQLLTVVLAATLVTYAVYTASDKVIKQLGAPHLYYSIVFVVYGLFRYLHLIHRRGSGGDPARTLLTDPPILICVFLWFVAVVWALYAGPGPAAG